MLKKIGIVDLIAAIQANEEKNTEMKCYDAVPDNAPSPFYSAEVVAIRPSNTKTMWCETYTVWIHAISSPSDAKTEIYELIQKLEESMTEEIQLPSEFNLVSQSSTGLQALKQDGTTEWHAVLSYEFKISYGFRCKI